MHAAVPSLIGSQCNAHALADVEFNLLYDRGVKFGLTPDSVERVLVSSPPMVAFQYKAIPDPGTPEADTLDVLRNPRAWA